jgi:hypothetical protein
VCKFCLVIKPERTHHCRHCRKCVLKYDHHCKFLASCIGFYNYKYFFVFLVHTNILLLFILLTSVEGLLIYINDYGWETAYCKIFFVWLLLCFLIFVAVLDLFIFHIEILLKGMTTLENKSSNKATSTKNCSSAMEESFGQGCCSWFCPNRNFF